MEPEQTPDEQPVNRFENLHTVTPLSKYLAMGLFVILPFVGGWIGYNYTTTNNQEINAVSEIATELEINTVAELLNQHNVGNESHPRYTIYTIAAGTEIESGEFNPGHYSIDDVPDDYQVILRSAAPASVGSVVETASYLIFNTNLDTRMYQGEQTNNPVSRITNSSLRRWFMIPKNDGMKIDYSAIREFNPAWIRSDSNREETILEDSILLGMSSGRRQAGNWSPEISLQEFHDNDIVIFSVAACTECGNPFTTKTILIHADRLLDSNLANQSGGYAIIDGTVATLELKDDNSYRYQLWPKDDGDPEKEYVRTDRETGDVCGPPACPRSNINWDNVPWREGDI